MHPTDLTAMGVISDHARDERELTQSALAKELHLSKSAVTALVDRLEQVGHVRRQRHPLDRRSLVLSITESASELSGQSFAPLSGAVRRSLAPYDDEELAVVARVLTDVVAAMSSASDRVSGPAPAGDPPSPNPPAATGDVGRWADLPEGNARRSLPPTPAPPS